MFHCCCCYQHFPCPQVKKHEILLWILMLCYLWLVLQQKLRQRKMVAMRGRGDRFNGILVRFNKKAMLKRVLGSCFFIEPCQYHEPLLFTPLNDASSLCSLQLPFHSETCIIWRLCTLHLHLSFFNLFLLFCFLLLYGLKEFSYVYYGSYSSKKQCLWKCFGGL